MRGCVYYPLHVCCVRPQMVVRPNRYTITGGIYEERISSLFRKIGSSSNFQPVEKRERGLTPWTAQRIIYYHSVEGKNTGKECFLRKYIELLFLEKD